MKNTSLPKLRSWIAWTVTGLSQVALYLCFTANTGVRELVASVIVAAIATFGTFVFARQAGIKMHLRWRDIIQLWRIPWYALSGTWAILHGLMLQLFSTNGAPSFLAAVRFDIGGDDPASAGRRALAVFYTTMTPNFVVLGLFPNQKLLLFHQIIPGQVLRMTQKLGARP